MLGIICLNIKDNTPQCWNRGIIYHDKDNPEVSLNEVKSVVLGNHSDYCL